MYLLTEKQKETIQEARKQIELGLLLTDEESNSEINDLLKDEDYYNYSQDNTIQG